MPTKGQEVCMKKKGPSGPLVSRSETEPQSITPTRAERRAFTVASVPRMSHVP